MALNALLTDVVVRPILGFKSFCLRLYRFLAVIAVQVEHPFVIGFPQLVANTEKSKSEVVVSCKYFQLSFPLEHHLNNAVNVLRLLRFLTNLPKDNVGIDPMSEEHGFSILSFIFVPNKAKFIRVHEIVAVRQVNFLVSQLYPDKLFDKLVAPLLHNL